MPEPADPPAAQLAGRGGLTADIVRNAQEMPDAVLISGRGDTAWIDVTAREFRAIVEAVARGIFARGVRRGDRVGLVAKTRFEWTLFDYALWWVGAVTVPVYDTTSAEQLAWLLADAGAVACIVETAEHRERIAKANLSDLRHVWTIDEGAVADLQQAGSSVGDDEVERRRQSVAPRDLATIIYTSGTTGPPKGCMLTHAHLESAVEAAVHDLPELFEGDEASTIMLLPLAHIFARVIQVGCVKTRVRLGFSNGLRSALRDLGDFRPTFVLGVPRVFEEMFNIASQRAHSEGRGRRFDKAVAVAIAYSRGLGNGRVNPLLTARHAVFDRLVYGELRTALGGRMVYAVSGGAPIGGQLAHFFRGIGVTVLEGYGLTETTGAVTVNRPAALRLGSVGQPIDGTTVRIAEDGEVLIRGKQVFAGYWRNDPATHEALDSDRWLHTGDLGEVDDLGFLRITGRKSEVLVTAGGKNVTPGPLEDAVRAHPLVSQCLVVGEARPYVAALITLDANAVAQWRGGDRTRAGTKDLDLRAEIQRSVDEANRTVSQAEAIRRFEILPHTWTEGSGHLTPTLKLKRSVVLREHRADVEELYR